MHPREVVDPIRSGSPRHHGPWWPLAGRSRACSSRKIRPINFEKAHQVEKSACLMGLSHALLRELSWKRRLERVYDFDNVGAVISGYITGASARLVAPLRRGLERPMPSRPFELVRDMGADFGLMTDGFPAGGATGSRSAEHALRSAGFQRLDPRRGHLKFCVIDSVAPLAAAARRGRLRCRGST